MIEGRCMKCKCQREMKNVRIVKTSRGGFMAKGQCKICGTNLCRILSKENAEKYIKNNEAKKDFD